MEKQYKVLITGAEGFIGKRLSAKFLRNYNPRDILLLVKKDNNQKIKELKRIIRGKRVEVKEVDLVSKSDLKNLKVFPKVLIHLAASTETSSKDHRANDIGTINLFEALNIKDENTHVVYTSTTAIYSGRHDCKKPIDESTTPKPSNEYGRTKLKAEKYLINAARKNRFRLSIIRLCTVYGKNTKEDGLFSILKKDIKKAGLISRINWPGLTSLVHVDDLADAIGYLTQKPPSSGKPEIFIVYSDSLTLAGISKYIYEATSTKYKPIELPPVVWKIFILTRGWISHLEKILPYPIYNLAWRSSLIVNDSLYCRSNKLRKRLPSWKPRKFSQGVMDVVS